MRTQNKNFANAIFGFFPGPKSSIRREPPVYLNTGSKTQNVEKLGLDLIFYNNFW